MNTQPYIQHKNLYEQDFNSWIYDTVDKLKSKRFDELDIESVIEEMEGLAARNRRELFNRLVVLLAHLLKWQYQTSLRCGSWKGTIRTQRMELEGLLDESPSLKNNLKELIQNKKIFRKALDIVIDDTGLFEENITASNPFTKEQILDNNYYPDE